MQKLAGIGVSPGIAIGRAYVIRDETLSVPRYDIAAGQVSAEVGRFRSAVKAAVADLAGLRDAANDEPQHAAILESHLLMLEDPEFMRRVTEAVERERKNAEWVVIETIDEIVDRLARKRSASDRSSDFHDISRRILQHLLERERPDLSSISEQVILVAPNLMPSDTISLNKEFVLGIGTDGGGKTSHTAIIARSFEIPAVLGLSHASRLVAHGRHVIVDGNTGTLILDPDKRTLERYTRLAEQARRDRAGLVEISDLPAQTRDGKVVKLEANLEVPEEVTQVKAHGADGIGLYRTEFLYIRPHDYPAEEEQYRTIRSILEVMGDQTVTVRTLDLGGDKVIPGYKGAAEDNPILGWRAVRFCLARPAVFRTQLRAMLRASAHGSMKMMFPMISGFEELEQVLAIVDDVRRELTAQGLAFDPNLPVGAMIEVPSAALTARTLADKVDFFSIGTNDLIQYTLAVDRGNEKIAYLYDPFHPGVLKLIKMVVDAGHDAGIPVGMCGEMAADPEAAVLLLGMGLDSFSMSAASIPAIKRIIRSVSMDEAAALAAQVLGVATSREAAAMIRSWIKEHVGEQSRR
jgi:phosphoenolpyruvate-protein phosphotransferase (PTS system enzyme I)